MGSRYPFSSIFNVHATKLRTCQQTPRSRDVPRLSIHAMKCSQDQGCPFLLPTRAQIDLRWLSYQQNLPAATLPPDIKLLYFYIFLGNHVLETARNKSVCFDRQTCDTNTTQMWISGGILNTFPVKRQSLSADPVDLPVAKSSPPVLQLATSPLGNVFNWRIMLEYQNQTC